MLDKKAATKEYKQTMQPMGIYQIKNLSTGKVLINSSKNLNGILNRSKFQLELGSYVNKELQEDYNSLGESSFSFDILDELKPKKDDPLYDYTKDLDTLKELWLEKFQPNKLYKN